CSLTYFGKRARLYSHLLGDAIHDIPPGLLAELLHEELAQRWQQQHFNENKPITYKLNGTVRQISVGRMEESVHVGVRSDYCCGVWMATHALRPVPREVIKTEDRSSCLAVSPHIPGELLVATESGAAYLWTSKEKYSHTLFRIGQTPDCKSGERVMMSKYLFDVNTYHHLVTTQQLISPMKSLKHLPVQIPHRKVKVQERLEVPL
ncbi:hypothetical protein Z043_125201, partial [Scleropages formosus]